MSETSSSPPHDGFFPMVFVDLETTGANFANDRIIEIGIVTVDERGVREWSTLINPEREITPFITQLTGIDNAMVADAPTFADVAQDVLERLQACLFVAHNARFDYSFLRREFMRTGRTFRAPNLCTVKLSRKLFPEHHRHSLEALLKRYNVHSDARHRALADARALWSLWQIWHERLPPETIAAAVHGIVGRHRLPPQLDPSLIDDLPEAAGAYALYSAEGKVLLCRRSANIRQQVLAHFSEEQSQSALFRDTTHIDWRETAGELGARLQELKLGKSQSKPGLELYSWQLRQTEVPGDFRTHLVSTERVDFARETDLYGLFSSQREALQSLRKLAEAHRLCLNLLGLAPSKDGEACAAYRQKRCRGACLGKEPLAAHGARLLSALAKLQLRPWPYSGAVALIERDEFGMREDFLVCDAWRYRGVASNEDEIGRLLDAAPERVFDADEYRLLSKFLKTGKLRVVALE